MFDWHCCVIVMLKKGIRCRSGYRSKGGILIRQDAYVLIKIGNIEVLVNNRVDLL
jgi:hypothetical protein